MARGPLTLAPMSHKFMTLGMAMERSLKEPPVGITQGGSSRRRERGAKVAAHDAEAPQAQAQVK